MCSQALLWDRDATARAGGPQMGWPGGVGSRTDHLQLFVVRIVQCRPLVLLMRLPLDGLVVGVQVGATETIIVLQETWREGTPMWAPAPHPTLKGGPPAGSSKPATYLVRVHLVGAKAASGPGRC